MGNVVEQLAEITGFKDRDVMDVTMFRFTDSVFTRKGQVGFLAWSRHGGQLIDTTAIRAFQTSAT